jgi:hypothetical protein
MSRREHSLDRVIKGIRECIGFGRLEWFANLSNSN